MGARLRCIFVELRDYRTPARQDIAARHRYTAHCPDSVRLPSPSPPKRIPTNEERDGNEQQSLQLSNDQPAFQVPAPPYVSGLTVRNLEKAQELVK